VLCVCVSVCLSLCACEFHMCMCMYVNVCVCTGMCLSKVQSQNLCLYENVGGEGSIMSNRQEGR
jgi:hypothetical protein